MGPVNKSFNYEDIIKDTGINISNAKITETKGGFSQTTTDPNNFVMDVPGGKTINISKEDFISTYEVSDNMLQNFNDYLNERTRYKITFVAYNDEIKLYLKAILAEQLYGSQAYSKVLNSNDAMLTRVREIIKSNSEILPKIR